MPVGPFCGKPWVDTVLFRNRSGSLPQIQNRGGLLPNTITSALLATGRGQGGFEGDSQPTMVQLSTAEL